MPAHDETITPDEFADRSHWWEGSLLFLPVALVVDGVSWVRDAIRQRGLPD
ncbi:MAG: hypothetical protein AAGA90_02620 [Actinomycetota bacterium]